MRRDGTGITMFHCLELKKEGKPVTYRAESNVTREIGI